MLDEMHEGLPEAVSLVRPYVLGRVGQHNVILVPLEKPERGPGVPVHLVKEFQRTFHNIFACLVVGGGGGVPGQADIRLGDVVVGTGVVRYNLDWANDISHFSASGVIPVFPPFPGVLAALRQRHEADPSEVSSIIGGLGLDYPEYARPRSMDRLFCPTYIHPLPETDCEGWCDDSKLLLRQARISNNTVIHYGAVASGPGIVTDTALRDSMGEMLHVLCFEQEAAYLMTTIPCLPIRGIYNYADSHKNKEWQGHAAAAAAVYATEVLNHLPVYLQGLASPQDGLDPQRELRGLLESLKFRGMGSGLSKLEPHCPGTCDWIHEHDMYQNWVNPSGQKKDYGMLLWITGKPGIGKSTLMKFAYLAAKDSELLEEAAAAETSTAAYFFDAQKGGFGATTSGMVRSLLYQLLVAFPDLQVILGYYAAELSLHGGYGFATVKKVFSSAVSTMGDREFACYIDGLDQGYEVEVADAVKYLQELALVSTRQGIRLRICLSSRHHPLIVGRRGPMLRLEDAPGHANDLITYVDEHLHMKDVVLHRRIRRQVLEKSCGIFLWVRLVVTRITMKYAAARGGNTIVQEFLAKMPVELRDVLRAVRPRTGQTSEDMLLCLAWIALARRPLTPKEYYHAIWIGLTLAGLFEFDLPSIGTGHSSHWFDCCLVTSSRGLAEITGDGPTSSVAFIHGLVRDFVLRDIPMRCLWSVPGRV
jgi:nucleoside phosphorylase